MAVAHLYGAQTPVTAAGEEGEVAVGCLITTTAKGKLVALRWWKNANDKLREATTIRVFNATTEAELGSVTIAHSKTASGWLEANLAVPVSLAANAQIAVAVILPKGFYAYTAALMSSKITNGILSSPATGGRFRYKSEGGAFPFPNQTSTAGFFVDVSFEEEGSGTKVTAGQGTETDAAQAVTKRKSRTQTPATETDTAQSLSRRKRTSVGQAAEADAAQPLSKLKRRALGQATETGTAQGIVVRKPIKVTLAAGAETDTAQPRSAQRRLVLGQVAEVSAARPITTRKRRSLTAGVETSTAQAIRLLKLRTLAPGVETDAARALTWRHLAAFLAATEGDVARPLSYRLVGGPVVLVPAGETSAAVAVTARKPIHKLLPVATETDAAVALAYFKPILRALLTAAETAAPVPLRLVVPGFDLIAAIETDFAMALRNVDPYGTAAGGDRPLGRAATTARGLSAARTSDRPTATAT